MTRLSLAGIPMELHLGSPAGEPFATRLNGLAELVDAGLFGADPRTLPNDSIQRFLERGTVALAEEYADLPIYLDISRKRDIPGNYVATMAFEFVDVLEATGFFGKLVRSDPQLAHALAEDFAAAGAWWFPVFGPRAAYETTIDNRYSFADEWWEMMREEATEALELTDRQATNRETRKYIRSQNAPTPATFARRIGCSLVKMRHRLPATRVPERIRALLSRPIRAAAESFHEATRAMLTLRRKMNRLRTEDDMTVSQGEDFREYLPGVILETSTGGMEGGGYVTELFTEYEQSIMNGEGWGPNYYFSLEARPASVRRLRSVLDAYNTAFDIIRSLKDSMGDP